MSNPDYIKMDLTAEEIAALGTELSDESLQDVTGGWKPTYKVIIDGQTYYIFRGYKLTESDFFRVARIPNIKRSYLATIGEKWE